MHYIHNEIFGRRSMKSIGIIGAMDIEITYILQSMCIEEKIEYASFLFHIGTYKNFKLVVVKSGIGKVNAACCAQSLISKFKVDYVINLGIAGSLRSDIRICDIVIGHNLFFHDVNKLQLKSNFPYVDEFTSDEYLEKVALRTLEQIKIKECNYHLDKIASGDDFISNPSLKQNLVLTKASCVDMEAASIAHACYLNKIAFLAIKCISGAFDETSSEYNTELDHIAAYSVSRFLIRMLNLLSKNN